MRFNTTAHRRNDVDESTALNAVCPYYTMFPLSFPLRVLRGASSQESWVLDPFCGRGTTNFAARLLGLGSVGIDSSQVAVAIAKAKLVNTTPERVLASARQILEGAKEPQHIPAGPFWSWAFHRTTLRDLCVLREALLQNCRSDSRILLRAVILGGLHGPMSLGRPSYFSNQCPRSFAPKPRYALRFWRARGLRPRAADVLDVIAVRAHRALGQRHGHGRGLVIRADSRLEHAFQGLPAFDWVVTSPPYYGMRTYVPDQWLRQWFLGGPDQVDYSSTGQLAHGDPEEFASQLRAVWNNAAEACRSGARLVCRFGGINDRRADPRDILWNSFRETCWRIRTSRSAGTAYDGKRQATQFKRATLHPRVEFDVYAVRQ